MIDPRSRSYFERVKALLEEQEALKADMAALKAEMEEEGELSKERVADLVAVAKLAVMDQVKRQRKEAQARRRAELEGQLSLIPEPAEPRRHTVSLHIRPTVTITPSLTVEQVDPDTGEITESVTGSADPEQQQGAQAYSDLPAHGDPQSPEPPVPHGGEAGVALATPDVPPADPLDLPNALRRGHPDCLAGKRELEAAE